MTGEVVLATSLPLRKGTNMKIRYYIFDSSDEDCEIPIKGELILLHVNSCRSSHCIHFYVKEDSERRNYIHSRDTGEEVPDGAKHFASLPHPERPTFVKHFFSSFKEV